MRSSQVGHGTAEHQNHVTTFDSIAASLAEALPDGDSKASNESDVFPECVLRDQFIRILIIDIENAGR